MAHSYEELRQIVLDLLSGREHYKSLPLDQFSNLSIGVASVFQARGDSDVRGGGAHPHLNKEDEGMVREVFWELFRQGIITLGIDSCNPNFPFFKISHYGEKLLSDEKLYFFHDVSTYQDAIQKEIPDVHENIVLYLKEAMQAFRSGCLLSSTVMLGVAAEYAFQILLDTINNNVKYRDDYLNVFAEKFVGAKINKFQQILSTKKKALPREILEDLDTHFAGIQAIIRTSRNSAGHPTGQIMQREQVYVLLNLFITYCKKLYQLKSHFSS